MKKFFVYIFLGVALVAGGYSTYHFHSEIVSTTEHIINYFHPAPCSAPIKYSIGEFDLRFGISESDFLNDINKAAQIWNGPFGRIFFQYASSSMMSDMTINLIYDYRQQATNEQSGIGAEINTGKTGYEALKLKYNSLVASYNEQKTNINNLTNTHASADTINAAISALNSLADQINSTISEINQAAKQLNQSVNQYNSIGSSTGSQFEEGVYIEDQSGRRINIYQYSDEDKLVRVLAHELGHSLGMLHVANSQAIMYALNEGAGGTLTTDDMAELERVCNISI